MSSHISSPKSLRCFVGVDFHVPRSVRSLVEEMDTLGSAVRATPLVSLHLTLKFLGDVEAEAIRDVDRAIAEAVEGIGRFEFDLVGTGVFPDERRPTVAWVGTERAEPLVEIAGRLEERFEALGFPRERRAFTPHLTIARVKARPPERFFELLAENADRRFGTVKVERIVLFESTLERRGAVYAKIAKHELG